MIQRYEVDAWLGDTDATDAQIEALTSAFETIQARYVDNEDRETAGTAAGQLILGDATIEGIAAEWVAARMAERERMTALTGAIIAAAQTLSEVQISTIAGINRGTVRKALGK